MKIKIKKVGGELFIDYYGAKDIHGVRFNMLQYIYSNKKSSLTFLIDTNLAVRKIPIEDILKSLQSEKTQYITEPVFKTAKKIFGFPSFIKSKKKPEKTENLIVFRTDKEALSKGFYDNFLKYYDYAVCYGCDSEIHEIMKIYKEEYSEVLFNKEFFSSTFYDSILFSRLRTDYDKNDFEKFVRMNAT